MDEEMTFLQARLRYRDIEKDGKALYIRSTKGTFNQIIMPEIGEHAGPFHWVYLRRSDGQFIHICLRNEQIVCIK